MARSFNKLREEMAPERRQRNHAKTEAILKMMPLYELRHARKMSQEQLAEAMNVKQASISKLEHRVDIYISTLRRYVEAMGGSLVIQAMFPDGNVTINQFHTIEEQDELADEGELTI